MPASESKKVSGIFISYRRSDTPDAVGRIYDRLIAEFGKSKVFKDVDSIPLGQDFRGHLNDVVGGCAAVLAIIGPRWADARNDAGQRRLEDPDDFVRIELEAALARNVPVVPVLVGHAPMPGSGQLPESLMTLIYRQAIEVRPDPDFHNDATRLVSALRLILDPNARVGAAPSQPFKWIAAFVAGAILAAAALAIPALKHLRAAPLPETRVEISTPATTLPLDFALSPDGRKIVFAAKGEGASRLWLRSLDSTTAQPLPDTEGATAPFWSPDGRSIGFFALRSLKRLDIGSGQAQTLSAAGSDGEGSWGPDGTILFVRGPADPVVNMPATGGAATEVTGMGGRSLSHRGPHFLPGGRKFLFEALGGGNPGIYLASLDGGDPVRLTTDLSLAGFLQPGWLVWLRAGVLTAKRLDVENAKLTGEPVIIADGVGAFSVSPSGLLAYRTGTIRPRQLTWVSRSGAVLGTIGDQDATIEAPRVAPDGRRVAFSRLAQNNQDIWLQDGERTGRMTFDGAREVYPIWSPDGSRIAYLSARSGAGDIYQKPTNGAGAEELLSASTSIKFPSDWSADGRHILYFTVDARNRTDIWVLPTTGDRKPFPFLQSPFTDVWPQFSPDGRWVAYQSDESGRDQVYVRPFVPPGDVVANGSATSGQWQVSTGGGVHPVWRADGKEIYFINLSGEMMAAPASATGSEFAPGAPVRLFQTNVAYGGVDDATGRQYDVAPDGRFLINAELQTGATPPITLIQNWNPDAGK